MARVQWIGDARVVPGLGTPSVGQLYDLADDQAASLIEQGKCVRVPEVVVSKAPVSKPVPRDVDTEE